jgi:hypothetical protein
LQVIGLPTSAADIVHQSGKSRLDETDRCCQSNGNLSLARRTSPKPNRSSAHDRAPLGECGRSPLSVDFAADEVALLIEVVVDLTVDRGEFLECFHPPKSEHRTFSSSERLV